MRFGGEPQFRLVEHGIGGIDIQFVGEVLHFAHVHIIYTIFKRETAALHQHLDGQFGLQLFVAIHNGGGLGRAALQGDVLLGLVVVLDDALVGKLPVVAVGGVGGNHGHSLLQAVSEEVALAHVDLDGLVAAVHVDGSGGAEDADVGGGSEAGALVGGGQHKVFRGGGQQSLHLQTVNLHIVLVLRFGGEPQFRLVEHGIGGIDIQFVGEVLHFAHVHIIYTIFKRETAALHQHLDRNLGLDVAVKALGKSRALGRAALQGGVLLGHIVVANDTLIGKLPPDAAGRIGGNNGHGFLQSFRQFLALAHVDLDGLVAAVHVDGRGGAVYIYNGGSLDAAERGGHLEIVGGGGCKSGEHAIVNLGLGVVLDRPHHLRQVDVGIGRTQPKLFLQVERLANVQAVLTLVKAEVLKGDLHHHLDGLAEAGRLAGVAVQQVIEGGGHLGGALLLGVEGGIALVFDDVFFLYGVGQHVGGVFGSDDEGLVELVGQLGGLPDEDLNLLEPALNVEGGGGLKDVEARLGGQRAALNGSCQADAATVGLLWGQHIVGDLKIALHLVVPRPANLRVVELRILWLHRQGGLQVERLTHDDHKLPGQGDAGDGRLYDDIKRPCDRLRCHGGADIGDRLLQQVGRLKGDGDGGCACFVGRGSEVGADTSG